MASVGRLGVRGPCPGGGLWRCEGSWPCVGDQGLRGPCPNSKIGSGGVIQVEGLGFVGGGVLPQQGNPGVKERAFVWGRDWCVMHHVLAGVLGCEVGPAPGGGGLGCEVALPWQEGIGV